MSLSKKNLDKLKNYIKNKKLNQYSNPIESKNENHTDFKNQYKPDDPNKLFYKLIDNSETLNETTQVNHLLKKSEEDSIYINSKRKNCLNHLTIEDELYDEFNYLLEE